MGSSGEIIVLSVIPAMNKEETSNSLPTSAFSCAADSSVHNSFVLSSAGAQPSSVEKKADDTISNQSSTDGDSDNVDVSNHRNPDCNPRGQKQPDECQDTFVAPDSELVSRINKQIELYFSDENILKDPFLLKHVRRNKEGYVSLKLIASFRKVKSLTKDWRVVAYSLKQSTELEVNEAETKVRRKNPLPDYDETTVSRTVVACNLPFDKPTVENVGEVFSKCGEISLIRILKPGTSMPSEIKKLLSKHPEVTSDVCALIEFEKHESALKAAKEMMDSKNEWKSLRILPLAQKASKKEATPPSNKAQPNGHASSKQERNVSEANGGKKKRRGKKQDRVGEIRGEEYDSPFTSSCSETEQYSPKPRKRTSGSLGSFHFHNTSEASLFRKGSFSNVKSSPASSPLPNRKGLPNALIYRPKAHSYCEGDLVASLSPSSPWVQKRILANNGQLGSCVSSGLLVPEGIIRLPRGPDGTKGFSSSREIRSHSTPSPLAVRTKSLDCCA